MLLERLGERVKMRRDKAASRCGLVFVTSRLGDVRPPPYRSKSPWML